MDLVYVSYNSEKWIEGCFESLAASRGGLKDLHVWIMDNGSTDRSVELLFKMKETVGASFASFEVICAEHNLGFGRANNIAAQKGVDDVIVFLNVDTVMFPETIENLKKEITLASESVGVFELRQIPYEHPKFYSPVTGETTWCSGAAFAIKRSVFEMINGFDPLIFMYAEDVDLSWRVRKAGYTLCYVPKATLIHYSYVKPNEIKPLQHINSVVNNLFLRYKFGGLGDIVYGHILFWATMRHKDFFPERRKKLFREYISLHKNLTKIICQREKNKAFSPQFLGFDYEINRDGAYFVNCIDRKEKKPLVSVIVRTCGRPEVLRETLQSIVRQTYENIEVVIVEDGENISETMVRSEFANLNTKYFATSDKVGRSKAGNIAMSLASGKYFNFLDDDDLFFADHVEVLVNALEESENLVAYATAFETPIEVESRDPYKYRVSEYKKVHIQSFDPIMLCHHNYIPIQCVMFERKLFELYGGLDETLDALEDWDMWVRYSLHTEFKFIHKTTSIYRVPSDKLVNARRQKSLDEALKVVREKHKMYKIGVSVFDIANLYDKK